MLECLKYAAMTIGGIVGFIAVVVGIFWGADEIEKMRE